MAQASAQTGEVMRVLRAAVAASVSCALRTRGSLSCPSVMNRKMDTPDKPDLALGAIIAAGLLIITEVLAPRGPYDLPRFFWLRKSKTEQLRPDSG